MVDRNDSDITSEELLKKALEYERQAIEMKQIGDFTTAHTFMGMAEAYFNDATEREIKYIA